jgi:ABC-2 type transport system permease protein
MNHKLRAVIRHEFLTIIRQPSFWISLFSVPLIIGVVTLIGVLTNADKDTDPAKNNLNVAVIDNSNVISADAYKTFNLKREQPSQQSKLESDVRSSQLDGLIVYPSDLLETGKYQLFVDKTDNPDADAIAKELGRAVLQQSLLAPLGSQQIATLAVSGGEGQMHSFTDGQPARQLNEFIVPGAFLIIFYIVLVFSVGYALSSVSEEKENRSIEMVLSYVKPRTLILGKLLAIIMVTLTQILIFIVMGVAVYFILRLFGNDISLPFDISTLTFVPAEIFIGAGVLVFGFIFYVALMAMIGAIFPSSKEANNFSAVFFILPAAPFWGINAIVAQEPNLFAQILSYFPLTSPTTVLLRNTVGNLGFGEGLISLAILILAAIITILLAARAFRLGTLEYTDRIKFMSLLRK